VIEPAISMKVLITGACGVTSRAVARSLLMSKRLKYLELIGIDVAENSYGLYEGLYRKITRSPHVTDPRYEGWIRKYISEEQPDAAILIPELEVLFWSSRGFPTAAILPPPGFCHLVISKRRLYEALSGTNLIPNFTIVDRDTLMQGGFNKLQWPLWLRDFSEGTTCGKGSLCAMNPDEAHAWAVLNPDIKNYMLAEILPGRNFACHLLYNNGVVKRIACYERIEYFMARATLSGVSGNISKGRLVNDKRLVCVSQDAINQLVNSTDEVMHGLVAVDLKEDSRGVVRITEINIRHVAATFAFALAGFNLSEAHLLQTAGILDVGPVEAIFPPNNMIFRDIDGMLQYVPAHRPLAIGESAENNLD
jgi:carbamoyl-phosphate synthase large subunit